MTKSSVAALALALLVPALPLAAQVAAEDPALAARVAAPLREELLGRMESWRPALFGDGDSGPVKSRYGARYDDLERAVRGQKHPGDIARSRYAFDRLLDDALHERYRQAKRDAKIPGGYDGFRERETRQAALIASGADAARRTSERAQALAPIPAAALFDGAVLGLPSAPEPAPFPEESAPESPLPSRPFASGWSLLPSGAAPGVALAHVSAVGGVPAVSYNTGETRVGGTRAWRNNNPGNIVASPWAMDHGAIAKDEKGYAIFPDADTAVTALDRLLHLDSYQDLQLNAAVARYAPPSENPTDKYVAFLSRKTGVDEWATLSAMTREQMDAFEKWIMAFEGTKPGAVVRR